MEFTIFLFSKHIISVFWLFQTFGVLDFFLPYTGIQFLFWLFQILEFRIVAFFKHWNSGFCFFCKHWNWRFFFSDHWNSPFWLSQTLEFSIFTFSIIIFIPVFWLVQTLELFYGFGFWNSGTQDFGFSKH